MAALSIAADQTRPQPAEQPPAEPMRLPCSLAQQRFWVLEQLDPGNPALNVAVRWRLEGVVATADLEYAWRTIIARHQTLRASFDGGSGEPVQRVEPEVEFRIPVVDLTGLPDEAMTAEAERIARLEARASFSLEVAPLIRVTRLWLRERVSVLLVTTHHLVCDGWSIGLLAHEMGEICAALHEGRPANLPELAVNYSDYALWQKHWLATAPLGGEDAFWRRYLEGAKPFEILPDRLRPPTQTSNSEIQSVLLDGELSIGLADLARRNGCTMFMTALAGLLVLLHRHTGETDLSIGTQVAGRNEVELEDLVGLFINTLVLRNDLSGDPGFLELLGRVRDSVGEVFEHQQMPLERLTEIINPARDLSRNALFSVNFIFQRSFIKNADYGGFQLVDLPSYSAGALYDLNFFMVKRPEGWRASVEYNTDLFEGLTIAGFLDRLCNVFRAIVADPEQRISSLPIIGPAERDRLIHDLNRTSTRYPDDRTLPQLFEAQAQRSPEAIAVVCGDREVSYRELDSLANRLAGELRRRGLGAGRLIGVFVDRSPELVAALLAVHKAGAAYVPLDLHHPRARICYVVENAGMAAVLTRGAFSDRVAQLGAPSIVIDEASRWPEVELTPPSASPEDLAYVIYTSGSTGQPKGVQVRQRALVNLLSAMASRPGLEAADTLLAVTTVSFDIAGLEIFLPLIVGAKLVIAREDEVVNGEALRELLRRREVTVLQATPTCWQLLLESGWRGDRQLKMLCGGELLPRNLADQLLAGGGELWNMYGPTETTIWSAAARVEPGEGPVPLGGPIANTQFYVLDSAGELVPSGAPGELHIGGDGVALGYLGLPKLTAERFVADGFRNLYGARLYRTGDIVRQLPGGQLQFLGRADQQIKLRGYRIELGEIESVLLRDRRIAEAAVVAGQAASGETAIWAYVVPRQHGADGSAALIEAARAALNQFLPGYMQPTAITVLSALPCTPNGKIDRCALQVARSDPDGTGVQPPTSETERRVAEIWRALLGLSEVGAAANFFDIGGNSLLAARLLLRLESELGRKISLASLFKAPTVQGLSRLLEGDSTRDFDFRQVVKLRPNCRKLPIVGINNTGMYYSLARRLCPDQPFTALQIFDLSQRSWPPARSFRDLAADYVRLLLGVQSSGPYILMGWCVGGALAFEAAQQLRRRGCEVALLVLIDCWVPGYLRRLPKHAALLANYSYRSQLLMSDWIAVISRQKSLSEFVASRNLFKRMQLPSIGLTANNGEPRSPERVKFLTAESYDLQLQRYLDAASRGYDPEPYDSKILLIRAKQQPKSVFLDHGLGWEPYAAGDLEIITVAGDHFTMFREPGVGEMAHKISAALAEAAPAIGR